MQMDGLGCAKNTARGKMKTKSWLGWEFYLAGLNDRDWAAIQANPWLSGIKRMRAQNEIEVPFAPYHNLYLYLYLYYL
jgi:hypothetical protein